MLAFFFSLGADGASPRKNSDLRKARMLTRSNIEMALQKQEEADGESEPASTLLRTSSKMVVVEGSFIKAVSTTDLEQYVRNSESETRATSGRVVSSGLKEEGAGVTCAEALRYV